MLGKRKAIKQQRLEEQKRERELKGRINVKRTLSMIKKQSAKLETFKKEYINKARNAIQVGNKQTYQLAKSGLKICITKQGFLDTMIANFEISMQISDMNKVISEFVNGMNILSDQIQMITPNVDMTKAQIAYEKAIANNAGQYEALDVFLSTAVDSIELIDDAGSAITDEEINNLISNQVLDLEDKLDKEIDEKISTIKTQMNNMSREAK